MEKTKLTWKEAHGNADYIPCGNAYCTDGNCANCETQMQLQVEQKTKQGINPHDMTIVEQEYIKRNKQE